MLEQKRFWGIGCGAVGRMVTSVTRDLRFESSHRKILFNTNFIETTKIKLKRPATKVKQNCQLLSLGTNKILRDKVK